MRRLITGLVIGFTFGAAPAASAGYYDRQMWAQMLPVEQLGYIAGVADALQAVNEAIQILGAERAAELVAAADRCTNPLKLGEVRDIARGAVAKHPDVAPAEAIFVELWDCSTTAPQPQPQPEQTPSSTSGYSASALP